MNESLVYKRGFDLLSHTLRHLQEEVDHQHAEKSHTPTELLSQILEALVSALGYTTNRRVQALLRSQDGTELARAEATDIEEPQKLDLAIEIERLKIGSPPFRIQPTEESASETNPTLICGHFLEAASWSGAELWLLIPRCTPNDQSLLSHVQTWRLALGLLVVFKSQLDVHQYLNASRDLFDEENRETFLSREAYSKLKELKLEYLHPELNPTIEDALKTLVQAALLVDVDLPLESMLSNRQQHLIEAFEQWTKLVAPVPRENLENAHRLLIEVLEALTGTTNGKPFHQEPATKPEKLMWLGWLTALLHKLSNNGAAADWRETLPKMTSASARFLADWSLRERQEESKASGWKPQGLGANYISPWLRIWLCHELMRHELEAGEPPRAISSARRRRYRLALVYVLRETVRFFLFGRRADYRFRPRLLMGALRRLVVHHAEQVVGLGTELDLAELLARIERSGEAGGRELSTGHLQHVFEVYITGQFLGSLGDRDGDPYSSLWDHLAGGVAERSPVRLLSPRLRRAFAVAALLHDFGNLLFPPGGSGLPSFRDLVRKSEPALDQLERSLRSAAHDIAHSALEALHEWPKLFSPSEWEAIERWQRERLARCGEPEPAVLAAWYIHGLLEESGLEPEIQRQVVRAIVLDRVTTLTVKVEHDPVAALLVICDALFAWDPRPPRHHQSLIGRNFSSLQGAGRQLSAQYDTLDIPGLEFRFEAQTESTPAHFSASLPARRSSLLPSFKISSNDALRGDAESVLALWLDLSIALGRVQDAGPRAAAGDTAPPEPQQPWIEVKSVCDESLIHEDFQLTDLVAEAAQNSSAPLRRALESWLTRSEVRGTTASSTNQPSSETQATGSDGEAPTKKATEGQPQCLAIDSTGTPFTDRDPGKMLDELTDRLKTAILRHRAARR